MKRHRFQLSQEQIRRYRFIIQPLKWVIGFIGQAVTDIYWGDYDREKAAEERRYDRRKSPRP